MCSARSAIWRPSRSAASPVDHRADLFAFGAILYEMLSGQRAFRRDTAAETMTAILNDDPPHLLSERAADSAGARAHRRALSGEKSGGAIPDGQRSRVRAGGLVGSSSSANAPVTALHVAPARAVANGSRGPRGVAAAGAGAACVPARSRAARCTRADALPDSADRRIGGPGKFQRVSGRPPPGFFGLGSDGSRGSGCAPWTRWTFDLFPGSEIGQSGASTVLVARQPVHRVRGRRQTQENGCVRRSASNLVRSAVGGCRRLVESRRRHHRREYRRRPAARSRDWRRRVPRDRARSHRARRSSICFPRFFRMDVILSTFVFRRARPPRRHLCRDARSRSRTSKARNG